MIKEQTIRRANLSFEVLEKQNLTATKTTATTTKNKRLPITYHQIGSSTTFSSAWRRRKMASLHGLHRGLMRIGGAATATTFVATFVGDKTAARISTQAASTATTSAGRFGRQQLQKHFSPSRHFSAASDGAAKEALESASSSSSKKGFVQWYEGHLESNPVATKMVTGCLLWSIGDGVAQIVPQVASSDGDSSKPLTYDWARTGRAALFGFAVHAPTSHVHFNFLEWMTVKGGFTGLYIPVFKTIMEQVR